jgi:hypothetical protein
MTRVSIGLWLLCAAILTAQLFVPPFIGIANNGDFGKVAGHLSLAPPDGVASNFLYFQPGYIHAAHNYWDSPYASSETVLAWAALRLSGATGEGGHFDIRWLGAVHAAIFLTALALLLTQRRILVACAAILIFTDVCYASYCNSFFMDAAALCGLLLFIASACWIASREEPAPTQIAVCALAGLLYVTTKTQHALWTFLPALFLAFTALRCRAGFTRRLAFAAGAVVLTAGVLLLATADATNRAQALFNKLFLQIGGEPGGAETLRELGVRPEELRYIGTHSYTPDSPASDRAWVEAFYTRTTYPRLAGWYLRNPGRALSTLWNALANDAPELRQANLSNFRQQDGHPPGARTHRFARWSDLRVALLKRWPWHAPLWYALFLAGAIRVVLAPRSGPERRMAWLALGVVVLGLGEFGVAALAECVETGRHLLLFQACTDLTVCFAVAWFSARFPHRSGAR